MKLFKQATRFASSPQGKQLLERAKDMDTPQNRRRAQQLLDRFRGGTKPKRAPR